MVKIVMLRFKFWYFNIKISAFNSKFRFKKEVFYSKFVNIWLIRVQI